VTLERAGLIGNEPTTEGRVKNRETVRVLVAVLLAPLLGLLAVILPVFLLHLPLQPAPVFPLVATGVERMSSLALILLFASGLALSLMGEGCWIASLFVMLAFPVLAMLEIAADPRSHSMLPLELASYGLMTAVAVTGGVLGVVARKRPVRGVT
jgi:hypothetical protein